MPVAFCLVDGLVVVGISVRFIIDHTHRDFEFYCGPWHLATASIAPGLAIEVEPLREVEEGAVKDPVGGHSFQFWYGLSPASSLLCSSCNP